jgi:hypothetical protein
MLNTPAKVSGGLRRSGKMVSSAGELFRREVFGKTVLLKRFRPQRGF